MKPRALRNRGPRETLIQSMILDQLKIRGIFAWRNQAIPVPIRRGNRIVGLRKALPGMNGVPDVLVVINGKLIGIEVKAALGRQSVDQMRWQLNLEAAGARYILARSWEEVAAALGIDPDSNFQRLCNKK